MSFACLVLFCSTCYYKHAPFFFLTSCVEKGLLPSLSYRNTSRLYATSRLVELTLNPSSHELGLPRLHSVCTENKMEENLNNLAEDLAPAEFAVPPGIAHVTTYFYFIFIQLINLLYNLFIYFSHIYFVCLFVVKR